MNKRYWSLVLLVFAFVALPSWAADEEKEEVKLWWAEVQTQSDGTQKGILWYEKDLTPSIGLFALATADTTRYAAAYAGPYWRPTEWLQLGVGIGKENQPNSTRRAAFYSIDTEKFYSFGTVESGGSGPWYRAHAIYRVSKQWSLGVMAERDVGFGPRVELNISEFSVIKNENNLKDGILWISLLRGNVPNVELEVKERKTTLMIGFSASF